MAEETGTGNLEVQKAINEAITARNALLVKQTELMKGQLSLAIEFQRLMRGENLEDVVKNIAEINKGLKQVTSGADQASGAVSAVAAAAKGAESAIKEIYPASLGAARGLRRVGKEAKTAEEAAEALGEKLGDAFEKTGAQMDSLFSMLGSITSSIFGMGSALLSIPLKVFGILTEKAAELSNSSTALREAYENVRETFGDLNKAEAKGVIDSFNDLQKSGGDLAGTGLSLSRIYGHGPEGLAAALNELNETAAAMGPVFGVLQGQFEQNADKILIMQKGLGLGNEEMKALGQIAIATGGDLTQMMQEMGNLALQMGSKFGISSKLLGKDLGYMATNMGKFGSMTKTQMITSAVYVRKLGLEIKDIEGLMGAFDNFEDAAQNAAKLAQGFGMTIDAMKMMKEQDPAKRLDMLRQAFAATGKSIESMSRQEKAMLAQSAGLDENMVSLALSNKNMGKSYEDIQKEADKSNKKQLSQAEVMDKLSLNIKRMTEALQTSGSFMTQFFNGLMKGFSRTPEFQRLMRNLARALELTMHFGMEVGKMIMDVFPGVKDMFGGLADFFEPGRFSGFLKELGVEFKKFFGDLSKDPVKAVSDFMKTMKEKFFGFFDKDGDGAKKFLGGLDLFGKVIAGVLGGIGRYLIEGATDALKSLSAYLKDPSSVNSAIGGAGESIMGPLLQAITEAGPAMWEALKEVLWELFKLAGPYIRNVGIALLTYNLAVAFATSLIKSVATGLVAAALKKIAPKLFAPPVPEGAEKASAKAAESTDGLGKMVDALQKIKYPDIVKALAIGVALIAFISVAVVGFAYATKFAVEAMQGVSWESAAMVWVNATVGLLAAIGMSKIADKVSPASIGKALLGVLGAALLVGVGLVAFAAAVRAGIWAMGDTPFQKVEDLFKTVGLAILATIALVAVGAGAVLLFQSGLILPIIAGLAGAVVFMTGGIAAFAIGISKMVDLVESEAAGFDMEKANKIFDIVIKAVEALTGVVGLTTQILKIRRALSPTGDGIRAIGDFMMATASSIVTIISTLNSIDMADPAVTEKKANIFRSIIESVGNFAKIAIDVGKLPAVNSLFGSTDLPTVVESLGGFLKTSTDSIKDVVNSLVGMALTWSEDELKKVETLANVIGAIAGLASSLMEPLTALAGVEVGFFDESAASKTDAIVGGLSRMMRSMSLLLPDLISSVKSSAQQSLSEDEAKGLLRTVSAIQTIASQFQSMTKTFQEMDTGWFSDNSVESLRETITGIESSLNILRIGLTGPTGIANSVSAIADSSLADRGKIDTVRNVFSQINQISSSLSRFAGEPLDASGTYNLTVLENQMSRISNIAAIADELQSYRDVQLGGVVNAIVEDIKAVNDALADLGDIDVNSTIDHLGDALKLKTEVLNIERKPIQMTVNLNLTMKAEDIAKEILEVSHKATLKSNSKLYNTVQDFLGRS